MIKTLEELRSHIWEQRQSEVEGVMDWLEGSTEYHRGRLEGGRLPYGLRLHIASPPYITKIQRIRGTRMSGWIESDPDYTEQIDWMCEQIAAQKAELVRLSNKISEQSAEIHKLEVLWEKVDILEQAIDANTLGITVRRVDELWGKGFDHHLRLLKLEESHEQDQKGS